MSTNYPATLDSRTLGWANRNHAQQHQDAVDALIALENEVGITGALTFLALTGGTMSGAIAMGSHKITGLTNGSAASDAAAFGQIPVYAAPVHFAPGNPAGTASTTAVQMGLNMSYTPVSTGNVNIVISGTGNTATAPVAFTVAGVYGSSTFTNGNAASGTSWGANANATNISATAVGTRVGWSFNGRLTGMALNTAIILDATLLTSNTSDAASIFGISCLAWESA